MEKKSLKFRALAAVEIQDKTSEPWYLDMAKAVIAKTNEEWSRKLGEKIGLK